MAYVVKFNLSSSFGVTDGATTSGQKVHTITSDTLTQFSGSVADSSNVTHSGVALGTTDIKAMILKSTGDVSVQFNISGQTINLVGNSPLSWFTTDDDANNFYFSQPITADITDVTVTNSSGATISYDLRFLLGTD